MLPETPAEAKEERQTEKVSLKNVTQNRFDFFTITGTVAQRTVMLREICGVREATLHKAAPNSNVSTVDRKTAPVSHYCTACFEKTFAKAKQPKQFEQEPERQTPNTPSF